MVSLILERRKDAQEFMQGKGRFSEAGATSSGLWMVFCKLMGTRKPLVH